MMGLDCLRCCCAALDNVRVKRALCQEFDSLKLRRFIVEYVDEFIADDFAFFLWVRYAFQFVHETLMGIHFDDIHVELLCESLHDLVRFAFTEQSMVNEDTCQLIAYRLMDQYCNNRRINAAAKCA